MAAAGPDVVLLHIGVNDLNWYIDPVHAPVRPAALVDRVHADRPAVSVVLVGVIPTTRPLQKRAAAYNVRAAALRRTERLRGRAFRYVAPPALTRAETKDRPHPDDAGYGRTARAFFPAPSSAAADVAHRTARAS